MMRATNRVEPVGPAQMYQTYQVLAPISTHFRAATCTEVACDAHLYGWKTAIEESNDLGKAQAYYVRNAAGRRYTETREAALTTFTFEAGQKCFAQHRVRTARPELYLVKEGDWRMSQNLRQHASADDWVDDFANHQDQLATRLERG